MSELREDERQSMQEAGWNTKGGARKLYTCHKFDCDYSTFEKLPKCPECGFPLYDAETFKILGVVLSICGLILTFAGVGLIILVSFRHKPGESTMYLIYALLGALALMGLAILTGGLKQAVTGFKSSSFITVFLVLLVIIGVLAAVLRLALGLVD